MVNILMGRKINILNTLIASVTGAIGSVLELIILEKHIMGYIGYLFLIIITDMLMIKIILFKISISYKEYLMGIFFFHGVSFAFVKLFEVLRRVIKIFATKENFYVLWLIVLSIIFSMVLFIFFYGYKLRDTKNCEQIYKVTLNKNNRSVNVKALFDTGNSLTEPFSGKPVSIIEKGIINEILDKEIINKEPQKYKVIPFKSIGEENGILEGLEIDSLIIWKDDIPWKHNNKKVISDVIIAIYNGNLSEDGRFQMILNHALL